MLLFSYILCRGALRVVTLNDLVARQGVAQRKVLLAEGTVDAKVAR